MKEGGPASEAETMHFTRERVACYKCPRRVVFIEDLPETTTAKPLKRRLIEIEPEART